MVYDIMIVNRTEDLLYHLKILNPAMKEEENARQVCTYMYALFGIAADMVNVLSN